MHEKREKNAVDWPESATEVLLAPSTDSNVFHKLSFSFFFFVFIRFDSHLEGQQHNYLKYANVHVYYLLKSY